MLAQTAHEVLNGMFGLVNTVHLFLCQLFALGLLLVGVGDDLDPDIQDRYGEGHWEIQHKHSTSQLHHTEVLEIQVEHVLPLLLLLEGLCLLLSGQLGRVFLQVKLEDVVDMGLLAHSYVPLALDESVLTVSSEDLARTGFELTDDYLRGYDLVKKIPEGHVDDFDAAVDVVPSNAVHDEFVQFLLSVLNELAVVLRVILHLLRLSFTILIGVSVLVDGGEDTHHAFEEQQDVVQRVDLELFEEGSLDVPLDLEGLRKRAVHVNSLQILHYAYLFAFVHLLVVLQQLGDDLLIDAWLTGFSNWLLVRHAVNC
mmetsp:Transcript_5018/g.7530  ORF Transcript_5018/g.7530 Transcript_5018/m.7530 type:complete len:312 (-) Transcript_5018:2542-3477(-)